MKKLAILTFVVILTGCASTSGTYKFPDVPDDLKKPCQDLAQVDPSTTKLSDALEVVTSNYSQYYECKTHTDAWIEWYSKQQQIFNSIK